MQLSPMADTSRPLFPNLRFLMSVSCPIPRANGRAHAAHDPGHPSAASEPPTVMAPVVSPSCASVCLEAMKPELTGCETGPGIPGNGSTPIAGAGDRRLAGVDSSNDIPEVLGTPPAT